MAQEKTQIHNDRSRQVLKTIKPLRQTRDGYVYGIEDPQDGNTEYIYIPFSKIEWFLYQLLRIRTQAESEALCSFSFDFPDTDMFYAWNYPPENHWDHHNLNMLSSNRKIRSRMKKGD